MSGLNEHSSGPSDCSFEQRGYPESPKPSKLRKGKKDKKEKGYAYIDRQSSEESLVESKSKHKKGKVFKLPTSKPPSLASIGHRGKSVEDGAGSGAGIAGSKAKGRKLGKTSKGILPVKEEGQKLRPVSPEPLFGISLEEVVQRNPSSDGVPVPAFLRQAIDFVNEQGLTTEGIYRVSAPVSSMKELRRSIELSPSEHITFPCPHHATGLIKLFLRELPEPLLSNELQSHLVDVINNPKPHISANQTVDDYLLHVLRSSLTPERFMLLAFVFLHIKEVLKHSDVNKMSFQNMGLMLWQTLRINDQSLLSHFLKQTDEIFGEVILKKYDKSVVSPISVLNATVGEIQEELSRQEVLLAALHEEFQHGNTPAPDIEQRLWDVQAIVTQLRRHLKRIRAPDEKKSPRDVEDDRGPCLEMFEEKQLWAIHCKLRNLIAAEKVEIEDLKRQIAEILMANNQLKNGNVPADQGDPEGHAAKSESPDKSIIMNGDSSTNAEAENTLNAAPNNTDNSPEPQKSATTSSDDIEAMNSEEELAQLEKERDDLIGQIIDEQNECAHLQAKLEMLNMDSVEQADGGDGIVITRF